MFTKEPIRPNFKCYNKARLSWLLLNIRLTSKLERKLGHFLTITNIFLETKFQSKRPELTKSVYIPLSWILFKIVRQTWNTSLYWQHFALSLDTVQLFEFTNNLPNMYLQKKKMF